MTNRTSGPSDFQKSIEKNNLKLSADKILQGLKKVRNEPSKSRKRWIWELLQNAKDVPNKFERVKVRVSLGPGGLSFAHNGDPFTPENITGLIQQVSTKASGGDDEAVTGKFGTGFISTHLLSEKVRVSGVTIRPSGVAKRFVIELDRSGRNSEELMPHIEATIDRVMGIDDDPEFVMIDDYEANRSSDDLDTELTYLFTTKTAITTAQVGLDDLRNTLPFTLANVPKIEEVVVVDETRAYNVTYTCAIVREDNNVREVAVTIQADGDVSTKHIVCWDADGITLMVEVEDLEEYALVPNFGEQPTLYRQFPLIGSEKFHFPFMVNGDEFFPTEERDGLQLNSEEDEDSLANRDIISRAMDEAVGFAEWLVAKGAKNRYVLAYTRTPNIYWEPEARDWFKGLQSSWRKKIRELALVENAEGGIATLKDAYIPKYGMSKKVREEFWEHFAPFKGYDVVPRLDLLHAWIEALGPEDELSTWGEDDQLCFELEDLLSGIEQVESMDKIELSALPEGPSTDPVIWLVDTLQFALDQEEGELLDKFSVVPNQTGDLKQLKKLYEESAEEPIPDEILDVMEWVDIDWRSELIDRHVKLKGLKHETRGIRDASEMLNTILTKEKRNPQGQLTDHFLFREDSRKVLIQLLGIVPPGTKDSFRMRLLLRGCDLFAIDADTQRVEGCAKFDFIPAIRLFIEAIHDELNELANVSSLAKRLNVEDEAAIQWLDGHLRDLDGSNEFKSWLEYGNIIPSRTHEFCAYEDLSNYGTDETPLSDTLLDVLKDLDEEKDENPNLIVDGIGIRLPNTLTLAELGSSIQECVKLIRADLAKGEVDAEAYREPLLELINWCEENDDDARKYLGGFMPEKDSLFFSLVARGNIGSGVIRMLGNEKVVDVLKRIEEHELDLKQVSELLGLAGELGSLDGLIDHAKEALEVKQDFEYKKDLGDGMENALNEALVASGYLTSLQGVGSYDIEITNPANGKQFFIELKSIAPRSTAPLKLAPSQSRTLGAGVPNRALCLIRRSANGGPPDVEFIRTHLRMRMGLKEELQQANVALDQYDCADEVLEIPLLGAIRVPLSQQAYSTGAGGFADLVKAINAVLA
ncbi:MAG: hypothetical protein IT230_03710 [Flavobacteriales bacterium]|nr:hypothetical protein [Flavobacteriales bacterium]